MLVKCAHCGLQENVAWLDTAPQHEKFFYQCSNRCEPSRTGYDRVLRSQLETPVAHALPRVTTLRAIALAEKIYEVAASPNYEWVKLSKKTKSSLNKDSNSDLIVNQYPIFGRAWRGLKDSSLTAIVVVFQNPNELPPYSIYVVFRGSSGDKNKGGSGFMGGAPSGGGQSMSSQKVNIDWRANFDNVQEEADWGGGGFMIHGGYKSVVGSYRNDVYAKLAQARRAYPGSNVVITGHSQGGGHAILFTHWLVHHTQEFAGNLFCVPFSPPRVGDCRFALSFTDRIATRETVLPFDGVPALSAMFVIRGHDPVSFGMEMAFAFKSLDDPKGNAESLRKWASKGIIRGGIAAQGKEAKYGGEGLQVYFHPRCLKVIPGSTLAKGKLQVLNHKPDWIRDTVLAEFNRTGA